jgi:hypothetical protein
VLLRFFEGCLNPRPHKYRNFQTYVLVNSAVENAGEFKLDSFDFRGRRTSILGAKAHKISANVWVMSRSSSN